MKELVRNVKEFKMRTRKLIGTILSATMIFSSTTVGFATINESSQSIVQRIVNQEAVRSEKYLNNSKIDDAIKNSTNAYVISNSNEKFKLPKRGSSFVSVTLNDAGSEIKMTLPKEVEKSKGVLADNGSVVYGSPNDSVVVTTQVLENFEENEVLNSLRTLVTIKNETAPTQYLYNFNMPDGYKMVKDYDLHDEYDEYDCGAVFILNQNGDIVSTIEPAWAKDAKGEQVKTEYIIRENTLLQTVEFDENSEFPITADPTVHPTKYSYYYLTKDQVKTMRDRYAELGSLGNFYTNMLSVCAAYKAPILGVGTSIYFINVIYAIIKKNTWNAFYVNFKQNYARIQVAWNWRNGGKNSGYVLGKTSCSYVSGIPM